MNSVAESSLMTSPSGEIKTEQKEGDKEVKKDGVPSNPMQNNIAEYQSCPHHRDIGNWFLNLSLNSIVKG